MMVSLTHGLLELSSRFSLLIISLKNLLSKKYIISYPFTKLHAVLTTVFCIIFSIYQCLLLNCFLGGGYIKYGFPVAYTTTMLSWGIIRYRRTYKAIGQLNHALDTIRWATDYFLKCQTGPLEFYGQVN